MRVQRQRSGSASTDSVQAEVGTESGIAGASDWRRSLGRMLRIGVSVALLGWVLTAVDPGQIAEAVAGLDTATVAAAVLLLLAQAALLGWRWHRLVHRLGGELPAPLALRWVFVGLFFNSALPTSVGGDAVKVWLLHRHGSAPGLAFASVAIERLTGVVVLALLVAACVPVPWHELGPALRTTLLAAGPLSLAGLGVAAFVDRFTPSWVPATVAGAAAGVGRSLRRLARRPAAAFELVALGIAASMCGLGAAFVIGRALGIGEPLAVYVVFVGGAVLLSVLPISLGGWGVREAGMVGLFGTIGVEPERALSLSLIWAGLTVAVSLPGGLLWWFGGGPASRRAGSALADDERRS